MAGRHTPLVSPAGNPSREHGVAERRLVQLAMGTMRVDAGRLVCPVSKVRLHERALDDAIADLGGHADLRPRTEIAQVGATPTVLVRSDGGGAYPIRDGVAFLLAPEMLHTDDESPAGEPIEARYAGAYEEMEHYSRIAEEEARALSTSKQVRNLLQLVELQPSQRALFPAPRHLWLDAKYELHAQFDAFRHLRPMAGKTVLQVGGRGLHAVKFLLAGAAEAWLVSPMAGELHYAAALARRCGVEDRFHGVAAVAEELPLPDASFDAVYSQGSVHHWVTPLALPECARVLRPGGRFAAVEPWRGPLYGIGTKLLGKREHGVRCVVLAPGRVEPHMGGFDEFEVIHHGALTRYPLIALWKLGIKPSRDFVWHVTKADDAIASRVPGLRRRGSSVAVLATRAGSGG